MARKSSSCFRLAVGVVGLAAAVLLALPGSPGVCAKLRMDGVLRSKGLQRWHASVSVLALTAFGAGMLDPVMVGIALVGGLIAAVAVPWMGTIGKPSLTLP